MLVCQLGLCISPLAPALLVLLHYSSSSQHTDPCVSLCVQMVECAPVTRACPLNTNCNGTSRIVPCSSDVLQEFVDCVGFGIAALANQLGMLKVSPNLLLVRV